MKASDLFVKALEAEGVESIVGIPGGQGKVKGSGYLKADEPKNQVL